MNTHSSGYYSIDEEYTIIGMQAQEQGLTTVMEIEPDAKRPLQRQDLDARRSFLQLV